MAITLPLTSGCACATLVSMLGNVYRDGGHKRRSWLEAGTCVSRRKAGYVSQLAASAACLILLLLPSVAQSVPDAPSTSQPVVASARSCGPSWLGGCWTFGNSLTAKQTFKSWKWWVPTASWAIASIADNEVSYAGTRRGPCVEGNRDLPLRPTRGDYYRNMAYTEGPLWALGWVFVKINRKPTNVIYGAMSAYGTAVHFNAVHDWYRSGCL